MISKHTEPLQMKGSSSSAQLWAPVTMIRKKYKTEYGLEPSYLFVQVSLFIRCPAEQVVLQDFAMDLHHGVAPRSRQNIWTCSRVLRRETVNSHTTGFITNTTNNTRTLRALVRFALFRFDHLYFFPFFFFLPLTKPVYLFSLSERHLPSCSHFAVETLPLPRTVIALAPLIIVQTSITRARTRLLRVTASFRDLLNIAIFQSPELVSPVLKFQMLKWINMFKRQFYMNRNRLNEQLDYYKVYLHELSSLVDVKARAVIKSRSQNCVFSAGPSSAV